MSRKKVAMHTGLIAYSFSIFKKLSSCYALADRALLSTKLCSGLAQLAFDKFLGVLLTHAIPYAWLACSGCACHFAIDDVATGAQTQQAVIMHLKCKCHIMFGTCVSINAVDTLLKF